MARDAFRDQLAVVTGGGSGLGAAMAAAFADRGARLALCDVSAERLAAQEAVLGPAVVAAEVVDVADRAAMQRFAEGILDRFGAPRVLVNNAGVAVASRSVDMTLDDWDWIVGVNINGVCYGISLFGPAMEASAGRAHIVNIASAAGLTGLFQMPAYSMTKCAVLGLSEAMRHEYAPDRLMTHVICPGFVPTHIGADGVRGPVQAQMLDRIMSLAARRGRGPGDIAAAVVRAIDRGRFCTLVYGEARLTLALRKMPDLMRRTLLGLLRRQVDREVADIESDLAGQGGG